MADLKGFRKANKLTQEQVADYLGIKKPFICKIETGREAFPEKHLQKLLENTHGWDTSLLLNVSETLHTEPTELTDTPTDEAVAIPSQVLEEMSAQRQLTEQALALVQEQLEAKQETIEAVREQLATTQEQLSAEQQQTSIAQQHLSVEQAQTNKALEEVVHSRKQMDELIMLLKKADARLERELALAEHQHHQEQLKEREHENAHKAHKHSNNNDA